MGFVSTSSLAPSVPGLANAFTPLLVGSGKSVLMLVTWLLACTNVYLLDWMLIVLRSIIVDAISEEVKLRNDAVCVYFYFQRGDNASTLARIWSTLLEQLLQIECAGGIAAEVVSRFNTSLRGSSSLHPVEYWGLFAAQAALFSVVYLVLDAPDNWLNHDGRIQSMSESLKSLPANVRLLFSTRNEASARDLDATHQLRIMPQVRDVEAYVASRIDSSATLKGVLDNPRYISNVVHRITGLTIKSGM